jgi:hypothetical protein
LLVNALKNSHTHPKKNHNILLALIMKNIKGSLLFRRKIEINEFPLTFQEKKAGRKNIVSLKKTQKTMEFHIHVYCQLLTVYCGSHSNVCSIWHHIFRYLDRSYLLSSQYPNSCLKVLHVFTIWNIN